EVLRVRGHEPQPLQAWDPFDLADERGQATATIGVVIVIDVLAEKHDLLGARLDRGRAFEQNLPQRYVTFAATHAGHDAERAVVVAALDDAHVMADAGSPGRGQRLAFRVVVPGLE